MVERRPLPRGYYDVKLKEQNYYERYREGAKR